MADFRDVVSVLPCSPTIKASRIFVAVQKTANRPCDDQGNLKRHLLHYTERNQSSNGLCEDGQTRFMDQATPSGLLG